jgi:hypothetical protein
MSSDKATQSPRIDKPTLDYFNTLLDSFKNAGIVLVGSVAVLFFLFPSAQIFLRDKMGDSRWYFVGTFFKDKDPQSGKAQKGRFRKADPNADHYHNFYLWNSYNPETGEIPEGTVLMVEAEAAVDRVKSPTMDDPSQWPIRQVSRKYECVYVLEWKKNQVNPPKHGAMQESQVWVRALPKACQQ